MSVFKELSESHHALRAQATSLFLIPFWYLALYLFDSSIYNSKDIFLQLAACLVLTQPSTFLAATSIWKIGEYKLYNYDYVTAGVVGTVFQALWLSVLMFIFWSVKKFSPFYIDFYWLIIVFYFPISGFGFWALFIADDQDD